VSSIDIVIYAANLVSDPRNIDPILDRLRTITARMGAQTTVSATDQEVLRQIYLTIEQYLIERETVRVFTRDSLRQTIANDLRLTNAPGTFWESLRGTYDGAQPSPSATSASISPLGTTGK
jgi:hypothetical protein